MIFCGFAFEFREWGCAFEPATCLRLRQVASERWGSLEYGREISGLEFVRELLWWGVFGIVYKNIVGNVMMLTISSYIYTLNKIWWRLSLFPTYLLSLLAAPKSFQIALSIAPNCAFWVHFITELSAAFKDRVNLRKNPECSQLSWFSSLSWRSTLMTLVSSEIRKALWTFARQIVI
jgi:hypothetical protein